MIELLHVFREFQNIQEFVRKRDVEGALELLNWWWNTLVREEDARALGYIGYKRAMVPLTKALKDKFEEAKRKAAFALDEIGDQRFEKMNALFATMP